ncbi:unnamed protein product [Orchesella dallaii]|uniref:Galectin n=1 Tax=Orchesella dallaii TaxID=48710 RepID=A0ABP1RUC8_9HEXA
MITFDIDLSQGADCSIVVFHFNPRFAPQFVGKDANVVVRNTLSADGWGNEERHSPPFPFLKGKCFKIVIRCGHDLLQISVDGQSFVDYKHRLPLEDINFLSISNGIEVSVIEVSGPK